MQGFHILLSCLTSFGCLHSFFTAGQHWSSGSSGFKKVLPGGAMQQVPVVKIKNWS